MQMHAKLWSAEFSHTHKRSPIDFLFSWVIELVERDDCPVYAVERYIGGNL